MQTILLVIQIVISVLLVGSILMQNRGAGVSAVFGGGDGAAYRTKRGLEKGLYIFTIILAILFVTVGVVSLIISA